jgi:uncharacterized protein (TIGR01777 family)
MRITITGGRGLIGSRLVQRLRERGDEVTVLSRSHEPRWDPSAPPPAEALAGRDAVVHLAGENLAQRWSSAAKRRIMESREQGTRNLVEGLEGSGVATLVSASAVGYYGPHGDEPVAENAPPGEDFPARVCVAWEREARAAEALGVRVVNVRTGIVLDAAGGALSKMLPPFKLAAGGPVAGGEQYMPWIHIDDVVGIYVAALDGADWRGPVNATAPQPVTNAEFSKALGRALHRPAVVPIPGFAIRALYGEMATIVTTGQRAVPRVAQAHGYAFEHPDLDEALRDVVNKRTSA